MDFPDIADKLIEMNTQVRKYKLKMILTVFVVTTEAQRPESSLCSENEEVWPWPVCSPLSYQLFKGKERKKEKEIIRFSLVMKCLGKWSFFWTVICHNYKPNTDQNWNLKTSYVWTTQHYLFCSWLWYNEMQPLLEMRESFNI